jgi:hypothetical protein
MVPAAHFLTVFTDLLGSSEKIIERLIQRNPCLGRAFNQPSGKHKSRVTASDNLLGQLSST